MSTLATGAPGGMTYCIVYKIEATAKGVPKNISKLTNSQNLYRKVSFWAIKSVVLRQRWFSVSRSIVSFAFFIAAKNWYIDSFEKRGYWNKTTIHMQSKENIWL